jgi:hypothetical protein
MRIRSLLLLLCLASGAVFAAPPSGNAPAPKAIAGKLTLPNEKEATAAIVKILGLSDMQSQVAVKLGTCIPAIDAKHAGQVACTVTVKLGAGTSETQADFYRDGAIWDAQPSTSQDKLPFPDPALETKA